MHRRSLLLLPIVLVAACATRMGPGGKQETVVNPKYLAKGDIDRVIDTAHAEVKGGCCSLRKNSTGVIPVN